MCQSIPACYDKSRTYGFWDLCQDIRGFLSRNPGANDESVKTFTIQLCSKKGFHVEKALKFFNEDLDRGKKLIEDPNESEAVHEIQKMYCDTYERVLSAFKVL